jgi:uncharacterized protein YdiU (UPF0061 family)
VQRDPLYSGNVINERCTIVSRIAPNFFRFGSFEIFKPAEGQGSGARRGPSAGNEKLKQRLLDHVLSYYPEISAIATSEGKQAAYVAFFKEIVRRTADLVAR